MALEAIIVRGIAPHAALGLQSDLIDRVGARIAPPTLALYSISGKWISIGRFQFFEPRENRKPANIYRRLTGGRACGAGDGWIGIALVAPSPTALLSPADAKIAPEQWMNRYVRGLLAALRALGVECFYPGRDAITSSSREIAMCTCGVADNGAMIFEIALAHSRAMHDTVADLESADPEGQISFAMYDRESSSTLNREAGRELTFDGVASAIVEGYGASFGGVGRRTIGADEMNRMIDRGLAIEAEGFLARTAPNASRVATITGQLGPIEVRLKISAGGHISSAHIGGCLIANAGAVRELESALVGQTQDIISISRAVTRVFATHPNFILGAGEISNLVRLITNAR